MASSGNVKKRKSSFGVDGLYLKKNVFYFRGKQVGGFRPKAVCLRTCDLTTAIIEAERLRMDYEVALSGSSEKSSGHAKMSEMIALYLLEKNNAGDFRPATHRCNTQMLEQSCKVMGDPYMGRINSTHMNEYSMWLRSKSDNPGKNGDGLSEATVHTYLNRLRCFFSWAVQTKRLVRSPMANVKIGRVRITKIHDFCTMDERNVLLSMNNVTQEVMTILHLGFFGGMRFMEMQALRWCDVQDEGTADGGRMHLLVRAHSWFVPKGKAARVIPAPEKLREYLRGIKPGKAAINGDDYVLAAEREWRIDAANGYRFNPKKSFQGIVKQSTIKKKVTYHTLRHSYITHHLNAGTSMSLISQWTGDDEATLRSHYAGYCPDVSRVEAIG